MGEIVVQGVKGRGWGDASDEDVQTVGEEVDVGFELGRGGDDAAETGDGVAVGDPGGWEDGDDFGIGNEALLSIGGRRLGWTTRIEKSLVHGGDLVVGGGDEDGGFGDSALGAGDGEELGLGADVIALADDAKRGRRERGRRLVLRRAEYGIVHQTSHREPASVFAVVKHF